MLHLGGDIVIPADDILAVLNITDTGYLSNMDFLKTLKSYTCNITEYGKVTNAPPKSAVIALRNGETIVYYTPIAVSTLRKRSLKGILQKGE